MRVSKSKNDTMVSMRRSISNVLVDADVDTNVSDDGKSVLPDSTTSSSIVTTFVSDSPSVLMSIESAMSLGEIARDGSRLKKFVEA